MTRVQLIAWRKSKAQFKNLRSRGSSRKMTRSRRKIVKTKNCQARRKRLFKGLKIILSKKRFLLIKAN